MNRQLICELYSDSAQATQRTGEVIGKNLKGGEIIELVSDLGGGKTTLVRGLAKGFGSTDKVASPTFTVSKLYSNGKLEMHHFDFYRVAEPGILVHELHDLLMDPIAVVVIEWAEAVRNVLPDERMVIRMKPVDEEKRQITISYSESLKYLLGDLC